MKNISLRKVSLLPLILSIAWLSFVGYYLVRCMTTGSTFYCDSFAFGAIFFIPGIPAVALLVLSIVGFIVAKYWKEKIGRLGSSLIIVLSLIIFSLPLMPLIFSNENRSGITTYKNWQEEKTLRKQRQRDACLKYAQEFNSWEASVERIRTDEIPEPIPLGYNEEGKMVYELIPIQYEFSTPPPTKPSTWNSSWDPRSDPTCETAH